MIKIQRFKICALCIILVILALCPVGCNKSSDSFQSTAFEQTFTSSESETATSNIISSSDNASSESSATSDLAANNSESESKSSTKAEADKKPAVVPSANTSSAILPETENKALPKTANELLSTMTLQEKIAQLFIVEPEKLLNTGAGLTKYSGQKFLYPVGGVILFADNIKTPKQCTDFLSGLQKVSKIPLFIAVDEEGGNVARIGGNPAMGTTAIPCMKDIKTEEKAYNVGKTIGTEIQRFGFNLDLAPVADITSDPAKNVMKGRSFGSDPSEVSKLVSSAVKGFRDSGMLCTLKHFPGHGNTVTDSHDGYTVLDKTLEGLREVEFPPFKAGIEAGANFVMLGHLSVPKITGNKLPATLSPELVRILREELGYQGLIMTDSLQMGAITKLYTPEEAAIRALEVGADVILMPANLTSAFNGIMNAVTSGRLNEERINKSVLKILELKYSSGIIPH